MTQSSEKPQRNAWLDTLRGIAASWVVIFHLNEVIPKESNGYAAIASLGYLGVPVFFIISGYCIWAAAQRSPHIIQFCWRRFCRIYLPYLVSLFIVITVCVLRKVMTGKNDVTQLPQTIEGWLATLTLTTTPISSVETINWVYWSLSYEVVFYLIIATTLVIPNYRTGLIYLLLGMSLIPSFSTPQSMTFFLDHWGLFTLGIGIRALSSGDRTGRTSEIYLIVASLVSIAMNEPIPVQVTAYVTAISIWFSDYRKTGLSAPNWMTHVGQISYGLYLLHVPLGCYLLLQFRQGIWLDVLPLHILYDFAVLMACIGASFIFFQWVEQPSISLGQVNPLRIRIRSEA